MGEIAHSESFCTALMEKVWKSCEIDEIDRSKSFCTALMRKDGKVAKWAKLTVSMQCAVNTVSHSTLNAKRKSASTTESTRRPVGKENTSEWVRNLFSGR